MNLLFFIFYWTFESLTGRARLEEKYSELFKAKLSQVLNIRFHVHFNMLFYITFSFIEAWPMLWLIDTVKCGL